MKKIIKLNLKNAYFDNNDEYIISENDDLELELERKPQSKFVYFVTEDKCWKFENGKLTIRHNELTDGYMYGKIEIREKGVAVRYYSVEPLRIVGLGGKYEVIPEIEVLKAEIESIRPLIKEVKQLRAMVETLAKLTAETLNIKVGGEEWFIY